MLPLWGGNPWRENDDSESVSFWLGAGADPNGLSSDQQSTALTAAVTHRQRGVIKVRICETVRNGVQRYVAPICTRCQIRSRSPSR